MNCESNFENQSQINLLQNILLGTNLMQSKYLSDGHRHGHRDGRHRHGRQLRGPTPYFGNLSECNR